MFIVCEKSQSGRNAGRRGGELKKSQGESWNRSMSATTLLAALLGELNEVVMLAPNCLLVGSSPAELKASCRFHISAQPNMTRQAISTCYG